MSLIEPGVLYQGWLGKDVKFIDWSLVMINWIMSQKHCRTKGMYTGDQTELTDIVVNIVHV